MLKNFDLVPLDANMILVWAVLFFVFWQLLEKCLFLPYLALNKARAAATVELDAQARKNNEEAEGLLKSYENQLIEERLVAVKQQISTLNTAKAEAAAIVAQAEKRAEQDLKQVRKEVAGQISTLRQSAFQDVDALAQLIAQKAKNPRSLDTAAS